MARTTLMRLLHRAAWQCAAQADDRPPRIGRRALLAGAAGASLSALLPAEAGAASARIAIVGAGLAGLTAAYQLRKAGYRPDVFEAGTRLGGRCYTARDVFADGQIAEHGGELIDTEHAEIRDLARELNLTLDDVLAATPAALQPIYIVDGQPYSGQEATRDFQPLYPILQQQSAAAGDFGYRRATAAARRLDALTIAGWVGAYVPGGRASKLGQLIESAFAEENAADADQQSALNVISVLAADPQDRFTLYNTESDQRFHVRGGNDLIARLLAERLADSIQTAMPLVAVARLPDGRVRISMKRDTEAVDLIYDRVILALPFSVMRTSVDIGRAGFRPLKRRAIATLPIGASVKFQLQFNRRLWTDIGCNGEMRLPSQYFQTTWEVTRAQPGAPGILNFFSGGTRALNAGGLPEAELAKRVLQDIEPVIPGISQQWNGRVSKDAWKANPWSLGSYSYFPPGYQTSVAGIESEAEGNCFFAGEHTAAENGYMNSAVQSGLRAAAQVGASLRRGRVR